MSSDKTKILLYGAYGFTGKLVVNRLKESYPHLFSRVILAGWSNCLLFLSQTFQPRILGRCEEKLAALSKKYECSMRTFSLDLEYEIDANLKDVYIVVHLVSSSTQDVASSIR
jgi:short subunit dehydrogenase-like uncharacterized protein